MLNGTVAEVLPIVLWDAGIDYVRLTAKGGTFDDELEAIYRKAATNIVAGSSEGQICWEPWYWQGYYGQRCAGVSYGMGTQGAILQVSGWQAQDVWSLSVPFNNVARLDIQCTFWLAKDSPGVAARVGAISSAYSKATHGGRWKVTTIDGHGAGDTCYIGSRKSGNIFRVYDKWREKGLDDDYTYAWRFEHETTDTLACALWPTYGVSPPSRHYWASVLRAQLRTRGIILPAFEEQCALQAQKHEKPITDDDSRIAWLRNQVNPAVAKLLASGWKRDHILQALGLE